MAKKPPFLKVIIEVIFSFLVKSNIEGVKKVKPFALFILCALCIVLLAVFDPSAIQSVVQFIINLL